MSWKRPNIGSRVNREVHARFWERAEVKFLRATRHERRFCDVCGTSALPPILTVTADILNRRLRAIAVIAAIRRTKGYGRSGYVRGSVRPDARELHHLGPFLNVLGYKLAELGGRTCKRRV